MSQPLPPQINFPSYKVLSQYTGSDGLVASSPYLIGPSYAYRDTYPDSWFQIPSIYPSTSANAAHYTSRPSGDFALSFTGIGAKNPPVLATVTFSGANLWATGNGARQTLAVAYHDFLSQVEIQLELSAAPVLLPGSTAI